MLNLSVRELVKATAPVLRQHGETLTRHFYARMFEHNPEMKQIFNQGHQRAGTQQQALAMAVTAYAEQIDDPSVLMPVLTMVVNKHISLGVRAEHYDVVGRHLLAAIREVLGAAATDELVAAWAEAYGALAQTLITLEQQAYRELTAKQGGWTGWRGFKIMRKQPESDEITSFYLSPADGGALPQFRPGQYISLRIAVPELGYMQPRQYSLSCAPGGRHWRISVKREKGEGASKPAGMVSNRLHDAYDEGDLLDLAPPAGDFFLQEDGSAPVVLLSAGVGITPMQAMLEHLLGASNENRNNPTNAPRNSKPATGITAADGTATRRVVHFLHAARHGGVHAFKTRLAELAAQHSQLRSMVYYESPRAEDLPGRDFAASGRIDLAALDSAWLPADAQYYLCGPVGFLQVQKAALLARGVPAQSIFLEVFGTGGFAQ